MIGHGGTGFDSYINPLPANTFTAITKAIDGYNADGVEIDIQLSKDSSFILFHDEDFSNSTGCTGCAGELTLEEATQCEYKNNFGVSIKDEKVTALKSILDKYKNYNPLPKLYSDIKFLKAFRYLLMVLPGQG